MYYRVVSYYLGDEVEFEPKISYENVDVIDREIVEVKYRTKEICFSKTIIGCFFAISMFLEENKKYYIYTTDVEPCIDLSSSSIGDFKASSEVRYRKNVKAKLLCTYVIEDEFLFAIQRLYENCSYNVFFDNDFALKSLNKDYLNLYKAMDYV